MIINIDSLASFQTKCIFNLLITIKINLKSYMISHQKMLIFFLLFIFVQTRFRPNLFHKYKNQTYQAAAANIYYFDQILDHNDYYTTKYWSQRYYVNDTFFDKKSGSIILYICGQWVCKGATAGAVQLANQTNGLIIALEHRYYGESMPFGSDSLLVQNLKYLTTQLALRDIAYFITQLSKRNQHSTYNHPWILVGGSYPGAMVAWFRYKYPHLSVGSVSSSGVVNAIEDYQDYDYNVYLATSRSGEQCSNSIINLSNYVQSQLQGPNSVQFKQHFNAEQLTNQQFSYYWADVIAGQIQYGSRSNLCNTLSGLSLQQQFKIESAEAILDLDPRQYSRKYLADPNYYNTKGQVGRAWNYQVCTQFGWFQTSSKKHSQRSSKVDLQHFRNWCNDIYGVAPNVKRTNNQFGGTKINVSNLFMVNAYEDPWRWASLQKSQGDVISVQVNCTDCAHCVDLHASSDKDAIELTQVRKYRLSEVKRWIEDYWRTNGSRISNIKLKINLKKQK